MCTNFTIRTELEGSAKGPNGWFGIDSAHVSFDHPFHAPFEHSLNIDFVNARELEQVKRMQPGSHLVLGILYQRAGLLDDAQQEFNTLYRANPNSELVKKLLRDVKSLRK